MVVALFPLQVLRYGKRLLSLSRPYLVRVTIDRGALAKDPRVLFQGGLAFAIIVVVEQLVNFAQVYAVQISGARATTDLRAQVFEFLQGRRLAFFDRQPVGRLEVDEIRGVDSGAVIEKLGERGLVEIVSRGEGLGRPLLYGTTPQFLEILGLKDLDELPRLEELSVALRPPAPAEPE